MNAHVESRIGRAEAELQPQQKWRDDLGDKLAALDAELAELAENLDSVDETSDTEKTAYNLVRKQAVEYSREKVARSLDRADIALDHSKADVQLMVLRLDRNVGELAKLPEASLPVAARSLHEAKLRMFIHMSAGDPSQDSAMIRVGEQALEGYAGPLGVMAQEDLAEIRNGVADMEKRSE